MVRVSLRCIYHVIEAVEATRYCCAVGTQSLREFMLYEFEPGYDATETTKNICCSKDESAIDYSTVARWLKNFARFARIAKPCFKLWR